MPGKSAKRGPVGANPKFTVDWFTGNEALWRSVLVPALSGRPGVRALEMGTYEGRSALWTLRHLLTGRGSRLVCIDDFSEVAPETAAAGGSAETVKSTCLSNLSEDMAAGRVLMVEGRAEDTLRRIPGAETFDLIYIDAGKSARAVLEQAVLAWPLLKRRGFLVFDDYTHSREHDFACPRPGIDAFLGAYAHEYKLRHAGWQVIVQKRSRRLPLRGCKSELFHEDLRAI